METLVTVIHVFVCIFLMITVLLQAGKGGGMGAALGGATQATVFGGSGAGGFLRKLTVFSAATFMVTSMTLAFLSSSQAEDALVRYSAQQRRADQLRNSALDDARQGAVDNENTDGEGTDGEGTDGEGTDGESSSLDAVSPGQDVEAPAGDSDSDATASDKPDAPAAKTDTAPKGASDKPPVNPSKVPSVQPPAAPAGSPDSAANPAAEPIEPPSPPAPGSQTP